MVVLLILIAVVASVWSIMSSPSDKHEWLQQGGRMSKDDLEPEHRDMIEAAIKEIKARQAVRQEQYRKEQEANNETLP